jgi:uncharacterized protein (TIGR03083 family)
MTDPHVARCLAAIRERSTTISDVVRPLPRAQWQASTNCPPWRVADLATHIATSGQGFVRSIRRGLEGTVEPAPGGSTPLEGGPPEVADALATVTDEFESLYDGLSDAQLDTVCFHRRGNRSIRWYAAHRLAEVTFHGWDLVVSLGRPVRLSTEVALLLLPTLLESNVPRTYAAGLSAERGAGERYLLATTEDPAARWLVTIDPDALEVTHEAGPADLNITAPASMLALLVYGRADLRTCGATLEGDASHIDRFASVFPRP